MFNILDKYIQTKNETMSEDVKYPHVKWLSHHIPKTAGTSMYLSLRSAFGRYRILRAYNEYQLAYRLNTGKPIWVHRIIKIIHGHFRPHLYQQKYFPNAKRVIWLRDPIDYNWSLLRHYLRNQNGPNFIYLKKRYIDGKNPTIHDLFESMLRDMHLHSVTRVFSTYLEKFSRNDFAFVGKVENYEDDIKRLGQIMGIKMRQFSVNLDPQKEHNSINKDNYRKLLQSEYEFLENWLRI